MYDMRHAVTNVALKPTHVAPLVVHGGCNPFELLVFLLGPQPPLHTGVEDALPTHLTLGGSLAPGPADAHLTHPGGDPLPVLAAFSGCGLGLGLGRLGVESRLGLGLVRGMVEGIVKVGVRLC